MSNDGDRARHGKRALIELFIEQKVLCFGDFELKSGRRSPYFFNLGAIHTGAGIQILGEAYAARLMALDRTFGVVFGPAYKGIPIAVATAEALGRLGREVSWAFNRKEVKDHGEGGRFVGAPVTGPVVLVDDVLTAGTALREAARLISAAGAELTGVVIALDRQETVARPAGGGSGGARMSAVQALAAELGVPVVSILNLQDVIEYLDLKGHHDNHRRAVLTEIRRYQQRYCIDGA